MARIQSIFGTLASSEGLQILIDRSKDMFAVPQWKKYFQWGVPSLGLTYSTVIGASRIEAMASVVDVDASAPLRSRQGLAKLEGEIPAIKEKFKMSQKMYREYMTIKGLPISDQQKLNLMLDMIFKDVKNAGNAPHMRLDYIALKMLSTAKMQLTVANNPDGIITDEVDLLLPSGNKYECIADKWETSATADPFRDIQKVFTDFKRKGITLSRMLMDYYAFNNLVTTDAVAKYIYGRVTTNIKALIGLTLVNQYLGAEGLPQIELVDATMGIESDGVIATSQPWAEGQVTFLPAGPVGTIHNALPMERISPVAGVSYADYDRVLVSKWAENDPWSEYTACELLAFPGWENIDQCAILDTKTKAS